jgi:phage terminase large subunit GpA-like protein
VGCGGHHSEQVFTLSVDTAKEIVFSRLRIGSPGPGYCLVPEWIDAEYIALLTAEKAPRKWVKNKGSGRHWIKIRERNEAEGGSRGGIRASGAARRTTQIIG